MSQTDLLLSRVKVALFGVTSALAEVEVEAEDGEGAEFFDGVRLIVEIFNLDGVEEEEEEEEEEGVEGVFDSCWR